MRKRTITLGLIIVFFIAFIQIAYAEMAQEGNFSGTNFYSGSHKISPFDKEHFVLSFENFGVNVSDSQAGPFHGMSTHNVCVIYFENGEGKTRGYFTSTDKDGDKIIWELNEDSAHMAPNPTKGKGRILEGTGKFKGIQGSMEYTRRTLRPAEKGTHQSISKFNGTYKIVQE